MTKTTDRDADSSCQDNTFAMSRFLSKLGNRKRPRDEAENIFGGQSSNRSNVQQGNDDGNASINGPLKAVTACLSGLAQDQKEEFHRIIVKLGGR